MPVPGRKDPGRPNITGQHVFCVVTANSFANTIVGGVGIYLAGDVVSQVTRQT